MLPEDKILKLYEEAKKNIPENKLILENMSLEEILEIGVFSGVITTLEAVLEIKDGE